MTQVRITVGTIGNRPTDARRHLSADRRVSGHQGTTVSSDKNIGRASAGYGPWLLAVRLSLPRILRPPIGHRYGVTRVLL